MFYALGSVEGAMIPMAMETHAVIVAVDRQTWSRIAEPRTGWGSTDRKCRLEASGKGFWINPPSGHLVEFSLVPDGDG